jgi:hypothetical protein
VDLGPIEAPKPEEELAMEGDREPEADLAQQAEETVAAYETP